MLLDTSALSDCLVVAGGTSSTLSVVRICGASSFGSVSASLGVVSVSGLSDSASLFFIPVHLGFLFY